ncbi:LEA type 2 family protein [Desulfuromonas acetexigens]|uniref:LEA type 2 family protein n=1 Tax=Trichloromonas acetexigens TaxID=38815 RepID=A0A550J5R7_9BACT|nr:LEA type 2 family protein [Desulfuromonas acetexigens]TRO78555.1 LEA type 2 family protein [Desulfuromonas acetexigens]
MRLCKWILMLAAILFLGGCLAMSPGFETPTVGLKSFRFLPSDGGVPRFEIGLHVVNPNRSALKLEGIVYSVVLAGHKVITGASADLPVIDAYSEGDVTLTATADLLRSIGLFSSLFKNPQKPFSYDLEAQLDIGRLHPRIKIHEKGEISLQDAAK